MKRLGLLLLGALLSWQGPGAYAAPTDHHQYLANTIFKTYFNNRYNSVYPDKSARGCYEAKAAEAIAQFCNMYGNQTSARFTKYPLTCPLPPGVHESIYIYVSGTGKQFDMGLEVNKKDKYGVPNGVSSGVKPGVTRCQTPQQVCDKTIACQPPERRNYDRGRYRRYR